ncbi:radical SAM protein [Streptomyces sp. AA1529]|uniref:radical SAM protein n=1 Tax=Streptomyces sp. AA1529 TaxID=1203257 RepID=UPI003D75343F
MHDPLDDVPVTVVPDRTLRVKIIDACGLACTFCHNEGTPVATDNTGRPPDAYTGTPGRSGRVSIYLATNGADFLPQRIPADTDFALALAAVRGSLPINEVHFTGGEPTLHPDLPGLIRIARRLDLTVGLTSNGENGAAVLPACAEAGLDRINLPVFGTTPDELAAVQAPRLASPRLAARKLDALTDTIETACTWRRQGAHRDRGEVYVRAAVAILLSVVHSRRRWRWRLSGAAGAGCCQGLRRHFSQCAPGDPAVLPSGQVRRGMSHPFRVAEEMQLSLGGELPQQVLQPEHVHCPVGARVLVEAQLVVLVRVAERRVHPAAVAGGDHSPRRVEASAVRVPGVLAPGEPDAIHDPGPRDQLPVGVRIVLVEAVRAELHPVGIGPCGVPDSPTAVGRFQRPQT